MRCLVSLMSTVELLERKSRGSVIENREYGHRGSTLTSPTSSGRLVGIVRSQTKAMELLLVIITLLRWAQVL
jgi:hypothetical protein